MNRFSCFALPLLVVGLLVEAMLPAADPPPPPPPPNAPPTDGPRRLGPPGQPGQRLTPANPNLMNRPGGSVPVERVMNEEQREQFRQELQSHRERVRELDEKSLTLRREYEDALTAEQLDEKLVREKISAMAEIDAERALIRARAFAKIRPSLSAEQLERLKALRSDARRGPPEMDRRPRPGPGPQGGDPLPPPRPAPPGQPSQPPPPPPPPR